MEKYAQDIYHAHSRGWLENRYTIHHILYLNKKVLVMFLWSFDVDPSLCYQRLRAVLSSWHLHQVSVHHCFLTSIKWIWGNWLWCNVTMLRSTWRCFISRLRATRNLDWSWIFRADTNMMRDKNKQNKRLKKKHDRNKQTHFKQVVKHVLSLEQTVIATTADDFTHCWTFVNNTCATYCSSVTKQSSYSLKEQL